MHTLEYSSHHCCVYDAEAAMQPSSAVAEPCEAMPPVLYALLRGGDPHIRPIQRPGTEGKATHRLGGEAAADAQHQLYGVLAGAAVCGSNSLIRHLLRGSALLLRSMGSFLSADLLCGKQSCLGSALRPW